MTDLNNVSGETYLRSEHIESMLQRSRAVLIGALVLVVGFLALSISLRARADEQEPPANVLLARLCVNEAGWNTLDCAAIGHIRMRSARTNDRDIRAELLYQHGARSLRIDRATNVQSNDRRPWIGDLYGQRAPRYWPSNIEWDSQGLPRWSMVLEMATGVIAGTEPDPCRQGRIRPNTWGGPEVDAERLARPGWQDAHCGATRNRFGRWGGAAPEAPAAAPTEPTTVL